MYKQASKLKLRFNTEKGSLTVEQLWDCSRAMLARSIKSVNEILKELEPTGDLDFLTDSGVVKASDPENTLRFKILKDIYITKTEEANAKRDEAEIRLHNDKIDRIIARKQDEELDSMSLEDLEKMRK